MNALDTHDTARFATSALPGAVPVAFGMAVTLPGIPVVFAGDEFGLEGVDGENSRSPLPWDALAEPDSLASERVALYSELIALRRGHAALNAGGIRWLYASDDVLVYIRESPDESVLLLAARADFDIVLSGLPAGETLYGTVTAERVDAGLHLSGTGPAFGAWQLPPTATPPL